MPETVTGSFDDVREVKGLKVGNQGLQISGNGKSAKDFEVLDPSYGYVIRSATKRWRMTATDAGNLVLVEIA